ncbi:type I restriction enzyme HsdR N-terminal domain-containing protein [Algoriphagus boritolerans]|uniref:type I restriction enzyme HsdR N-terminal domain-containing protein n=1 Tax=Algoriphagus boritolerans TaxID=308111 RepID=UPI002FCE47C4
MIYHRNYPKGLFSLEKGLKYNQLSKRTDLVVFDRQSNPFLLVECKAPGVKIDEKTLDQIMTYNSRLQCPNLVLSNGLVHVYLEFAELDKKIHPTVRLTGMSKISSFFI